MSGAYQTVELCGCKRLCGDDGDIDGSGTCKGLPVPPEPPLVEIILVPRDAAAASRTATGEDAG